MCNVWSVTNLWLLSRHLFCLSLRSRTPRMEDPCPTRRPSSLTHSFIIPHNLPFLFRPTPIHPSPFSSAKICSTRSFWSLSLGRCTLCVNPFDPRKIPYSGGSSPLFFMTVQGLVGPPVKPTSVHLISLSLPISVSPFCPLECPVTPWDRN